ncbi:MAG: matrixin family metalloprotease [Planctomycetaceae bacterium]|nr:matrixin family metalloprotease [Planctomycetaceae bacterium]
MALFQILNLLNVTRKSPNARRRFRSQKEAEILEVRSLLTTFAWSNATSLTISFAPDGTDIAGTPSGLNSQLDQLGTPAEWQGTIVHGFQTWLNELGFDLSVVSDTGADFGINGATRGDARFGDVRVGAVPLSPETLATAIPQNAFISGTWAGDMMLNSNLQLNSLDELYALSLHEAGHILGLEHSSDPASPMFDHAGTVVLQPTAQDIAVLKSLYSQGGGKQRTSEDESSSDDDSERTRRIVPVDSTGMFPHFEVTGVIGDAGQIDTFVFSPGAVSREDPRITTIVLQTTSTDFIPDLTLSTASGRKVESTIVANGNGLIILQSRELEAEKDYVVKVRSAFTDSRLSQGRYELAVTFSESAQVMDTLARGTLDREKTHRSFEFAVGKTELYNFLLVTKGNDSKTKPVDAAVVLSVVDEAGRVVFRAVALPGQSASNNTVMLREGTYQLMVDVVAASRRSTPEVEFAVRGSVLSTDAGPLPRNPVGNPLNTSLVTLPYTPEVLTTTVSTTVKNPVVTTPSTKPKRPPLLYVPVTWQQLLLDYPSLGGRGFR